jgi:hypothetical protein
MIIFNNFDSTILLLKYYYDYISIISTQLFIIKLLLSLYLINCESTILLLKYYYDYIQ